MVRFLKLIAAYFLITCFLIFSIPYFFAGPYTDAFYLRFTSPRNNSLVIGTSRAAQAIIPDVLNPVFKSSRHAFSLYNYSFTIKSSPYGAPYLRSILRKIDLRTSGESRKDVLYLVTVDPWSVSTLFYKENDGDVEYEEENYAPNNMRWVDIDPNPEYVFRNVDNRLLMMIRKFRHVNHPELMADGSLNVAAVRDAEAAKATTADRIEEYEGFARVNSFSVLRFKGLRNTLDSLNKRGICFLVRIPVHPGMRTLEERFMPGFDDRISRLAKEYGIGYLNYSALSDSLQTTDGNHLDRKSAIRFSAILAEDIIKSPLLR